MAVASDQRAQPGAEHWDVVSTNASNRRRAHRWTGALLLCHRSCSADLTANGPGQMSKGGRQQEANRKSRAVGDIAPAVLAARHRDGGLYTDDQGEPGEGHQQTVVRGVS